MMEHKVLIVEDDREMADVLKEFLQDKNIETDLVYNGQDALKKFSDHLYESVIMDINLPGMNGLELCEKIHLNRQEVPVIVITAFGNVDFAIQAIRAGAYDFIPKPFDLEVFYISLNRALNHYQLQDKVKQLSQNVSSDFIFDEYIGASTVMKNLYSQITRVAGSDITILITGESGTGKELTARTIHKQSSRSKTPFIAINCAAIPETLLESELFGYKKGAFTDAKEDKKGLFIEADSGTLFLDEMGELPINLQAKLLRVLEEKKVRPIGSKQEVPVDVRIIAATNIDLDQAVKEHQFREDLFYRLNVIELKVPPLRERDMDIIHLSNYFIQTFAKKYQKKVTGLNEAVIKRFLNYEWPGNIRELKNTIERAIVLTNYDKLCVDDLPEKLQGLETSVNSTPANPINQFKTLKEMETEYIQSVLTAVDYNKTKAAQFLGIDRKTLYRKMEQYQIQDKDPSSFG